MSDTDAREAAEAFLAERLGPTLFREFKRRDEIRVPVFRRPVLWPVWRLMVAAVDWRGYLYLGPPHDPRERLVCVNFAQSLPYADRVFLKLLLLCADPEKLLKHNGRQPGFRFKPWRPSVAPSKVSY